MGPTTAPIDYPTFTPSVGPTTAPIDYPTFTPSAFTLEPALTKVYSLQGNVSVTMAQVVDEMDVSSMETFRNTTEAFLGNWLRLQVPPVSHVKVTVLNQSLSKSTLRRRVAQGTDIIISMLVRGDTKAGDLDLVATCNTIFDDNGTVLVVRLQETKDTAFSQVVTVKSTNYTPVEDGRSKNSPVEGGSAYTGGSNSQANLSIYIWIAISVGGAFVLVASFGTIRFIYKKRNEEHEYYGEDEEDDDDDEEEEQMNIWPSSVVPMVLTPNVDFESNTSLVEKVKPIRLRSRRAMEPLFEDETLASEITNGADTNCGCKMLGCTCGLKLAQSM